MYSTFARCLLSCNSRTMWGRWELRTRPGLCAPPSRTVAYSLLRSRCTSSLSKRLPRSLPCRRLSVNRPNVRC
jgi:hypothetical protein